MPWVDALQVGTVILGGLGGGGAIVFGFSRFLGEIWLQGLKGDIDARLQRLDAALKHRNFLLQRFAEFELEAITECWRAARACLPLINAIRPVDSGTDEAILQSRFVQLAEAHNALITAEGRHEPFLPSEISECLDALGRVLRLELSHIQHHEHFKDKWWEEGAKNRQDFEDLCNALLQQVNARKAQLRADAIADEGPA